MKSKNLKSRIASVLLAVAVVLSMVPFTAIEANAYSVGIGWVVDLAAEPVELQPGATKLVNLTVFHSWNSYDGIVDLTTMKCTGFNSEGGAALNPDSICTGESYSTGTVDPYGDNNGVMATFLMGNDNAGKVIVIAEDDIGGIYTNIGATAEGSSIYYDSSDYADLKWNTNIRYFSDNKEIEGVKTVDVSFIGNKCPVTSSCESNIEGTDGGSVLFSNGKESFGNEGIYFTGSRLYFSVEADEGFTPDELYVTSKEDNTLLSYVKYGKNKYYIDNVQCGINVNAIFKGHKHGNWEYTVSGTTLIAECGNSSEAVSCNLTGHEVSLELNVKSKTFDGEPASAYVDASELEKWAEVFGDSEDVTPVIRYVGKDGSSTDYDSTTPPSAIGSYTAILYIPQLGCKKIYSARADFTIKTVVSPAVSITKLTKAQKAFKATWKKASCTGYMIRYSRYSSMKNAATVKIKGSGTVSKTVSKLTGGKKYYVQIRTYKTVAGKTFYSNWSAKKAITTKK